MAAHIRKQGSAKTRGQVIHAKKQERVLPGKHADRMAGTCSFAHIDDLDSYLALDAAYGIESAAIIWGCEPLPPCSIYYVG